MTDEKPPGETQIKGICDKVRYDELGCEEGDINIKHGGTCHDQTRGSRAISGSATSVCPESQERVMLWLVLNAYTITQTG